MSEELEAALEKLRGPFRRLMELREDKDTKVTAAEKATKEYKQHELEVFDAIEGSPLTGSIKLDLGEPYGEVSFGARETPYGRLVDEEAAMDYFENSAQVDEYTKAKISKKRLHELVRGILEDEDPKMPPGIDYYYNRGVTITRKKN